MAEVLERPAATMTIKLDAGARMRLKSLAHAKKRTAHYLMKEAIERYLTVEEAQQNILKSVDESIEHFETTGLHVTLDEVRAWSKELQTNRNAALPECHL